MGSPSVSTFTNHGWRGKRNLTEVTNWEGLFRINGSDGGSPSSLEDAPVIRDVHMIGGETSYIGGFILQSARKHFIVNNCSSSGVIRGDSGAGAGGICGQACSGDTYVY